MPVPKRKLSKKRRDQRNANKGLSYQPSMNCPEVACPATGLLPHQVCLECGHYRGKKVLSTKTERSQTRVTKQAAARSRASQNETSQEVSN